MDGCCGGGIPACERMFDEETAADDLRRVRGRGLPWATRELVDALASGLALDGLTVLDVGAGIGSVHLALLERSARHAVDVDGSSAYIDAARSEAARRGLGDRVRHLLGDLTVVAPGLERADLVALDRVVCCYGDAAALLGSAAALAGRRLGLVCPRDRWWIRAAAAVGNLVVFRGAGGYRMHVHRAAHLEGVLRSAGLERLSQRDGRLWRIETWQRRDEAVREPPGGG